MKRWIISVACLMAASALAGAAHAQSTLADMIQAGDRRAALAAIERGEDVNAAQGDGATPLHWAVYRVDQELVERLLASGANADVTNAFGSSPLREAVTVGHADMVRMLLEAGADPESPNEDGQTALMLAVRTGEMDIVRMLVERGAGVNATEGWRNQTVLMWAAAQNEPEIAEYLIENGAEVNVRAAWNDWERQITSEPRAQYRPVGGLTPLLYAARQGCYRCAVAMVEAGADIEQPTPEGVTPLIMAIDNFSYDIAEYLLDQGADPHRWDWWGRTPLYAAIDMSSFVRGRGGFGEPTIASGLAQEAAAEIARERQAAVLGLARRMLDMGVNVDSRLMLWRPGRVGGDRFLDDSLTVGATPLFRAALAFDLPAIELLLEYGATVDMPNVMGNTPFMIASGVGISMRDTRQNHGGDVQSRVIPTLERLLEAGADINARIEDTSSRTGRIARRSTMTDREGQTAIYGAVDWGWERVVEFLIENGARVDIMDALGKTPLDAAYGDAGGREHRTFEEIAALIEAAGGERSQQPQRAEADAPAQ